MKGSALGEVARDERDAIRVHVGWRRRLRNGRDALRGWQGELTHDGLLGHLPPADHGDLGGDRWCGAQQLPRFKAIDDRTDIPPPRLERRQ